MKYIKQPSINTSSEYSGGFQGTKNLTFSTSSNQGLSSIRIIIYGDTTRNSAMNLSVLNSSANFKPYNLELLPTTNSSVPQNLFIELIIEPQSFIVQIQTDKRLKTVLASFGLLGGAYGLTISLLVLLFDSEVSIQELKELKQKLDLLQLLFSDYLVNSQYLKFSN
ncbi:hypothetical protein F8M41_020368 [Gigaspora margarita]|uniref:Uncharacterized protein n=1 Tax=Gigaspora margarita TaxID=4874 RepID=A0A8H4AIJ4_GIGMA|nr:hypothetical protein F8M41_020368 [Gigaspora margarita]